ncbi:unnamed protein product [Thlaspi arvense]|uniref:Uncharacterized protein n=1 Tax=Thlaspi arvense TaxID=13288 RepID=A0AAU9S5D5_THLAR|nr:unnamed protein product [Thlaspi arvense]
MSCRCIVSAEELRCWTYFLVQRKTVKARERQPLDIFVHRHAVNHALTPEASSHPQEVLSLWCLCLNQELAFATAEERNGQGHKRTGFCLHLFKPVTSLTNRFRGKIVLSGGAS